MRCKICGSELEPGATQCRVCGVAVDVHDYVNDPFSLSSNIASNQMETGADMGSSVFFPTSNKSSKKGTFFQNTGSSHNSSSTEIKPIYVLVVILVLAILVSSGILLSKVIFSEEKPYTPDDEIIFGSGDELDPGKEEPTTPEPTPNPEPEPDPTPNPDPEPNPNPEPDPEPEPEEDIGYTSYAGFKFKIPDGYDITIDPDEKYIALINQKDKLQIIISIYENKTFSVYKNQVLELQKQWEDRGYTIYSNEVKTIDKSEWLILDSDVNGTKLGIIYRSFLNKHTMEMMLSNYGNLTTEEFYSRVEEIIATGKVDNNPTNVETNQTTNNISKT